eukprot:evm.model.NODE_51897_length_13357_cov_48.977242.1
MPARKSVRFEDLDDGAEDGVYGLKVHTKRANLSACEPGILYVFMPLDAPPPVLPPCNSHRTTATSSHPIKWYRACSTTSMPKRPATASGPAATARREQAVLEMEKVQVKELLAQGYPPQELQRMGMTLEPSVLQGGNEKQR